MKKNKSTRNIAKCVDENKAKLIAYTILKWKGVISFKLNEKCKVKTKHRINQNEKKNIQKGTYS